MIMSKSIIKGTQKGICYLCRRFGATEEHHIFGGVANRKKSERDGLKVDLCHFCHNEPPNGVHFNKDRNNRLRQIGQRAWMERYGKTIEDFIKEYGKNYL
jgi:hypothetical protein